MLYRKTRTTNQPILIKCYLRGHICAIYFLIVVNFYKRILINVKMYFYEFNNIYIIFPLPLITTLTNEINCMLI